MNLTQPSVFRRPRVVCKTHVKSIGLLLHYLEWKLDPVNYYELHFVTGFYDRQASTYLSNYRLNELLLRPCTSFLVSVHCIYNIYYDYFIFQTIFQFEVQQKCFQEALLRFAQFFVSPLLKEDSTDRELEAVDSGENLTDFYHVLISFGLAANSKPVWS